MKKIFMSILAFAAVAMTMTSCNKEEATYAPDLQMAFEDTEVMNNIKTHVVGDATYWDNGDAVYIIDSRNGVAKYVGNTTDGLVLSLTFNRNMNGNFDANNAPLVGLYPTTIVRNYRNDEANLPKVQNTIAGELDHAPLYAKGDVNNFMWKNLCALVRFNITGSVAIDSISVTTDKYLNGIFTINMNNLTSPLTYKSMGADVQSHGTKTTTLKFDTPFQTTSIAQQVEMYLPAQTYTTFIMTFYANGNKYEKRVNADANLTLNRSRYNVINVNLDALTATPSARYNVGTAGAPVWVEFSKGNLEYIAAQWQYWQFASNQWDFRGIKQNKDYNIPYDRDLFAWGANGYYYRGYRTNGYVGNNVLVWPVNKEYAYCTATTLAGTDEWGNNNINGSGNNSGWRTLTETEMTNLLANHHPMMVTLDFVNETGMLLVPDGYIVPSFLYNGCTLTKARWNEVEIAGCVFFVAKNYRKASGRWATRLTENGTNSYFWLNTDDVNTADENTAPALIVTPTGYSIEPAADKRIGGFVRLVKDLQ